MFDTQDEILAQLRAGEDGRAEFKEVRLGPHGVLSPNAEDLAGELVAFANAAGGAIFSSEDGNTSSTKQSRRSPLPLAITSSSGHY